MRHNGGQSLPGGQLEPKGSQGRPNGNQNHTCMSDLNGLGVGEMEPKGNQGKRRETLHAYQIVLGKVVQSPKDNFGPGGQQNLPVERPIMLT